MVNNPQAKLVLQDRPLGLWVFGFIFFVVGLALGFMPRGGSNSWIFAAVFGGIGLVVLLVGAQILTITLDKSSDKMTLDYWAPLWRSHTEIPISQIASMHLESTLSRSSRSHTTSRTYRVVVIKKDGTVTPLRSSYSSGADSKRKLADQIGDFIGVGQASQNSARANSLDSVLAGVQAGYAQQQSILAGAPVQQEQVTNGVHWHLETHTMGASPVTRWVSPDFKLPGSFVMLNQKVGGAGVGDLLGGAMGRFLTQQAMSLYGISPTLTPGIGSAQPVPNLDPQLGQRFDTLTSAPDAARQIINPWVSQPLINWAQQNPAQAMQSPDRIGPLLVLYSPDGLYLTFFNLASSDQVQALTQLGVDLVRAQGTGAGSQTAW
jgi:hypothetical protein